MAGIGFELNKLAKRDDLMGTIGAYFHSAMAIAGPWLFTVIALAAITILHGGSGDDLDILNFRGIIIYNFSFSLVLAAPVFMVMTRYLADAIHIENVTRAPSVMIESLLLVFLLQLPVAIAFYVFYFDLPVALRLAAFCNMFLISSVWLLGVFLTALKDYNAISKTFLIGMALSVFASYLLTDYGATGMVMGFNIGLMIIVFGLIARILAEYPYKLSTEFALRPYFRKYRELAWGGLFYNAAIWIDKWVMWFAPEGDTLPSGMIFYQDYDSAMFLAFLTIIPSLALFVFSVETRFFRHYRRFYEQILAHAPLQRLRMYQNDITESIFAGGRNLIFLQGAICFVTILLAPRIFEAMHMFFMQLGMFRLGTLGALFHVLLIFECIILSYFDCRRHTMWIYLFFMVTNALFTWISMDAGFPYYGYGYFLASAISFIVAGFVVVSHVRKLPFHSFITNNTSINPRVKKVTV